MMNERFSRSQSILGKEAMDKLFNSSVAIFGLGGVGGAAAEALVRTGVGKIFLVDDDIISVSNINRQIIALDSTVGELKAKVMADRAIDINPDVLLEISTERFDVDNYTSFNLSRFDYVVDAIDSMESKVLLVTEAYKFKIPIISCMGAGNKIHPEAFEVDDIFNTSVCPMAKIMRQQLKKNKIEKLKVVYSKELPIKITIPDNINDQTRFIPGSVSFVPPVAGYILAGEVIRDLISNI